MLQLTLTTSNRSCILKQVRAAAGAWVELWIAGATGELVSVRTLLFLLGLGWVSSVFGPFGGQMTVGALLALGFCCCRLHPCKNQTYVLFQSIQLRGLFNALRYHHSEVHNAT